MAVILNVDLGMGFSNVLLPRTPIYDNSFTRNFLNYKGSVIFSLTHMHTCLFHYISEEFA